MIMVDVETAQRRWFPRTLQLSPRVPRRFGVELSDQTLCGGIAQSSALPEPLYQRLKRFVLASKVVGTDDTPVKVLDRKLPQETMPWRG